MNPLDRVYFFCDYFYPAMFDINEELTYREMHLIAKSHNVDLRIEHHDTLPEDISSSGDFRLMFKTLSPINETEDGYKLAGAWDNEDGEVVLIYARQNA